jgi:hypothetical protein
MDRSYPEIKSEPPRYICVMNICQRPFELKDTVIVPETSCRSIAAVAPEIDYDKD